MANAAGKTTDLAEKVGELKKPETDRDSGDHRFDQFGLVLGFKSYPKRQAIIIPKILWGVT
ncbi:hypothetical protein [Microcystis aeruginosa]|uniref:Uncharacterized protein n=1 Tax=Microcystis aeruginosa NIES-298 TaxID=449468 RepID=A0A2H6BRH4_MICAE|nr:hypothetical protein [Microcystis aeruginosa]GBD52796.1 hypothetical protein BGM30_18890 [Microcystis aeruginosa NIES-298]GBE98626.1 hypothetical protein NIES298_28740 [Microcystis aeruginosa NIES-298]